MGTPPEDIPALLQSYVDDARALSRQLVRITFYMRGGIDLDQAHRLTFRQRQDALQLIEENLELTQKTGQVMY